MCEITIMHRPATQSAPARLAPGMPLATAARAALSASLDAVREQLASANPDAESIGTAARRAIAALDIFRTCVGQLERRRMRKCVRRLHDAADEVVSNRRRCALAAGLDADVEAKLLRDALAEEVRGADRRLARLVQRYEPRRFDRIRDTLLETLHQPGSLEPAGGAALEYGGSREVMPSRGRFRLIDAARHRMPRILHDLNETAALDVSVPANAELLIRRIERLHFSLELFGSCLRDVIDDIAPMVARVLEDARALTDRHVMIELLDHLAMVHVDSAPPLRAIADRFRPDALEFDPGSFAEVVIDRCRSLTE